MVPALAAAAAHAYVPSSNPARSTAMAVLVVGATDFAGASSARGVARTILAAAMPAGIRGFATFDFGNYPICFVFSNRYPKYLVHDQ